jgi:DNA-3-methyladenine glycosylase II
MTPSELLSKDRKLAKLIAEQDAIALEKRKNICLQLCLSIMSQQLSTAVARVFHRRFIAQFSSASPSPTNIAAIPFDTLRSIGLSNAKATYIHNVAAFFAEHKITDAQLHKMDDEEIILLLTQIKGVGRWTVEMILMFSMAREDVFSIDDLGIQQAFCKLYRVDASDKKAMKTRMMKQAEKWKPFRTYACLHLWAWKDNKAAAAKKSLS